MIHLNCLESHARRSRNDIDVTSQPSINLPPAVLVIPVFESLDFTSLWNIQHDKRCCICKEFYCYSTLAIQLMQNNLLRKKLLLALQAMNIGGGNAVVDEPSGRLDYNWVMRWLDDLGLPQYKVG